MIKILLLDDNANKIRKVVSELDSIAGIAYEIATDLVSARLALQKYFDILIIDMNLPERFGEDPIQNKGIEFIKEIKASKRLKFPNHIIGLTEYPAIIAKFKDEFEKNLISVIQYDEKGSAWRFQMNAKITYIVAAFFHRNVQSEFDYDVAFIAALLTPELQAILDLNFGWTSIKIPNDPSNYYIGKIRISDHHYLNAVATYLPQMGLVSAATTTTKVINAFKPKFVVMTGICGGIKGKVKLGDIIIADLAFDAGSGKIVCDNDGKEKFEPDYKAIQLSPEYKEDLIQLSTQKEILRNIKDVWQGEEIHNDLQVHIGPLGSGAAVIANSTYAEKILTFQRKLLGIDMETYGIFYACNYSLNPKPIPLSIKGVSDYADAEKNDNVQKYCSTMTAKVAEHVIKNILKFQGIQ